MSSEQGQGIGGEFADRLTPVHARRVFLLDSAKQYCSELVVSQVAFF
jgi:hypothetical protein